MINRTPIVLTVLTIIFMTANFLTESLAIQRSPVKGIASYYSYECANCPMANGKIFDPEKRTCASWFYPFGSVLEVESLDTGKKTRVIVTDRGPNKRLVKEGRTIDLSRRAFEDIRDLRHGLTGVVITLKSK